MLLYPNVASRAQREIDRVTGGPGVRLPTREDRDKLPYIDYIIKESLRYGISIPLRPLAANTYAGRWNPAVPLGKFTWTIGNKGPSIHYDVRHCPPI